LPEHSVFQTLFEHLKSLLNNLNWSLTKIKIEAYRRIFCHELPELSTQFFVKFVSERKNARVQFEEGRVIYFVIVHPLQASLRNQGEVFKLPSVEGGIEGGVTVT